MRLASLCYSALRISGVTTLARRLVGDGVVLCYHNVVSNGSAPSPLGLHMPLATFERQVRWLLKHYAVVPLDEIVSRLLQGRPLRGMAAITFDDGYEGVFEHAWPLLRHLGVPATVFVVADAQAHERGFWWDDPDVLRAYSPDRHDTWLTALRGDRTAIVQSIVPVRAPWQPPDWCRPATWRTIGAAAESGLQVGVHTVTHRALPALDDAELHRELVESRDTIRDLTGANPPFFAYPYGVWNDRVRRAVQAAGYRAAFTLGGGPAARTTRRDPMTIPRVNVPAGIEDAAFQAWTAGLRPRRQPGQ